MTFELLFNGLRVLHIAGGSIALIAGYGALMVTRGGARHRALGRTYVYGMVAVALTGLPMSIIHPNPFLFGIVVFSSYFVFSGRAAALNRSGEVGILDKGAALLLLVTALAALAAVAYVALGGIEFSRAYLITGTVFGLIGLRTGIKDLRRFRAGPIRGTDRVIKHLVGMCAALIATTTAVAVTLVGAVPAIPPLVAWLGPAVVIVPIIFHWARRVRVGTFTY